MTVLGVMSKRTNEVNDVEQEILENTEPGWVLIGVRAVRATESFIKGSWQSYDNVVQRV
jgi:hypothetical protein